MIGIFILKFFIGFLIFVFYFLYKICKNNKLYVYEMIVLRIFLLLRSFVIFLGKFDIEEVFFGC